MRAKYLIYMYSNSTRKIVLNWWLWEFGELEMKEQLSLSNLN